MQTRSHSWQMLLVGDLILDQPDPDAFFDRVRAVLVSADLVAGHVEVPHTRRGQELGFDVPAPASDPDHIAALARAGFHVATLAGNHIYDRGPEGVADTMAALAAAGLRSCGAGPDLDAARQPAIVRRAGIDVGFLSYNCVGPRESWAADNKPGCAFIEVVQAVGLHGSAPAAAAGFGAHSDREHATDAPQSSFEANSFEASSFEASSLETSSLEAMRVDIARLRERVELVVVAFHKGIVHVPARLAGYERTLGRIAIDAGADLVVGHHAHILRGIELYRGRPIFHGLGNFVTVTRALDLDNAHPQRREWARKRRELFGFTPDPAYPNYPFHPEAKHAMIAACRIAPDGRRSYGFLPCWILPSGQPEIVRQQDDRGAAVKEYVAKISRGAGFETEFAWDGDWVVVS